MSKRNYHRHPARTSAAKKQATLASHSPRPAKPKAEEMEAWMADRSNKNINYIVAIILMILIFVALTMVDVSGCSRLQNPDDYLNCEPYSLIEKWFNLIPESGVEE